MNHHLFILHKMVAQERRRLLAQTIVLRFSQATSIFLFASTALHLAFWWMPLAALPLVWDILVICYLVSLVGILFDNLLFRPPELIATARLLEQEGAQKIAHPLLSIALELEKEPHTADTVTRVFAMAADQAPLFAHKTNRNNKKPLLLLSAALVVALTALVLLHPRLCTFWHVPFNVYHEGAMTIRPGSLSVPFNASVTCTLQPYGLRLPSSRFTRVTSGTGKTIDTLLRPDSNGIFTVALNNLTASTGYWFSYGAIRSREEKITVVPLPLLYRLLVTIVPPAYTHLPRQELQDGVGDFSAYGGSEVQVSLESSALQQAFVLYGNDSLQLQTNGTSASGSFIFTQSDTYTFLLQDTLGQMSRSLPRYHMNLTPDAPPAVRFIQPGENRACEPSQRETLWVEGADDIGLQELRIFWRSGGAKDSNQMSTDLSKEITGKTVSAQVVWEMQAFNLYPGDTLFYWARGKDGRSPGHAQEATTDTFYFRIPSFREIHEQVLEKEQYAENRISEALAKQREILSDVAQLDRATAEAQKPTWNQQQMAKQIKRAVQAQADSLQKSLASLEENVDKMRNEGKLDDEITKKMAEIQKALQELIAQFGDSLLFKPQQGDEMTMDELRQSIDKLKEMLPELSKQLDNALQYLAQLKNNREFARLAEQAQALAAKQAQLTVQQVAKRSAAKQNSLLQQIRELQEQVQRALGKEAANLPGQTLQKISDEAAAMQQQMEQDRMPSVATQNSMSSNLASLGEQLQSKMSSAMVGKMHKQREQLLDLAHNALDLASWQKEVDRMGHNKSDAAAIAQAESQQALREAIGILKRLADSLSLLPPAVMRELRKKIEETVISSNAARAAMGEMDGSYALRISERALSELAAALIETVAAMDAAGKQDGSSGNGGEGVAALRKLSGKQAAINAATAHMLQQLLQGKKRGMGKVGDGPEGGSESARRAAEQEQRNLAEALRALQEKGGESTDASMKKRLDALEKEARRLTEMLKAPSEEISEQQDRFLAKMLQSALSMHREDEGENERQAKRAETIFNAPVDGLDDSLLSKDDALYRLRSRALQRGTYPLEYRRAINAYFDSLGVMYRSPAK